MKRITLLVALIAFVSIGLVIVWGALSRHSIATPAPVISETIAGPKGMVNQVQTTLEPTDEDVLTEVPNDLLPATPIPSYSCGPRCGLSKLVKLNQEQTPQTCVIVNLDGVIYPPSCVTVP